MRIEGDRLWAHLTSLCERIGPRLSGTPGDELAVEYIAGQFRACGAEVEVQDFPCPAWECQAAELALLEGPDRGPLRVVAQTFTEGCQVEGRVAVVSTRHELEYRPDLEGRVLLVQGDAGAGLALDRNAGLLAIEERRPLALLVAADSDLVPTKLVRDPFLRVPAAAVPAATAAVLRRSEGLAVRLSIRARRYASSGHNVIGRLAGMAPGRIVVGAHYDTAAGCVGAVDDASGTAAVLELCRALAAAGAGRGPTLEFIAFGAEEYGRHVRALGSVEYVRRHPAQVRQTLGMVQLDCVGTVPPAPRVHLMGWDAERRRGLPEVLGRFPGLAVDEEPVMSSDHAPFFQNGVPALAFMNAWEAIPIHTPADTIEFLDHGELAQAARAAGAAVQYLAEHHAR